MSYYFWLGDYHPLADESDTPAHWAETETNDGFTLTNIEADGFITIHPDLKS